MKRSILAIGIIFVFVVVISAQKTNDAIAKQIKSLKADKQITLTYDSSSNTSKINATASNFESKEAKAAGIEAMNFGMAFFYPGKKLTAAPAKIKLTFCVLSQKPRFADAHGLLIFGFGEAGGGKFADSHYVSNPSENMEHLNFELTWEELSELVFGWDRAQHFRLGSANFTFTSEHRALLRNLLAISDPATN